MSEQAVLSDTILNEVKLAGWKDLSTIQAKAIPVILRRRNTLLVAPTGSGKTEAALFPIFASISGPREKNVGVRVLYITPLRSLNRDILRRILRYASRFGLTAEVRHGDTSQSVRQRILASPPDVLVTTPETVAIMITSPKMKRKFEGLEWVVVDELHELLGNERGAHLSLSLARLEDLSRIKFTRIGLSATIGDLDGAAKFLCGSNKSCAVLLDPTARTYNITCSYTDGGILDLADSLAQLVTFRSKEGGSIIMFTNTRDEAEYLGSILKSKVKEIPVEIHHGSLSAFVREDVENKLKSGKPMVVVATSSLELGLDIGSVKLVVQVGSPRQGVKMLQRIGRSRHQLKEAAEGMILVNKVDDELESRALMLNSREGVLEKPQMHFGSLDVLAHHLTGLALERFSYSVDDALLLAQRSFPFREVSREEVVGCSELLDRMGIVRFDGDFVRRRGSRTFEYYYSNISMIPDIEQFAVVDSVSRKSIGRLDQMFVGEYCEPGMRFILKGSSWNIVSVDDVNKTVSVEPVSGVTDTVPQWIGELIPVAYASSQRVGRIRRTREVDLSASSQQVLDKSISILGCVPDDRTIVVERKKGVNALVLHCCFGTKVNQTLATVLSTLLSSRIGFVVEARSDPYRILLVSQAVLDLSLMREVLKNEIFPENLLGVAVVGTHPLNWKTWHVAKRFGVVSKGAQYDRRASRLIQVRFADTVLYKEVLRELFLEKYELDKVQEVLKRVRSGVFKLVSVDVDDFSPLARPILDHASAFTALPQSVERSVLELVKERLLNSKHRIVCMLCGWERVLRTKDAPDVFTCPVCRSRIIGASFHSDEQISSIVRKKKAGKALNEEEERSFRKAWRTSSFIQNSGKTALVVLSGFGVGPETASRILRGYPEEEDFLRAIYRAEKLYVATRGFWHN